MASLLRKQGKFAFCQHAKTELEEDESPKPMLQGLRHMSKTGVRSAGRDLGSPPCPGTE